MRTVALPLVCLVGLSSSACGDSNQAQTSGCDPATQGCEETGDVTGDLTGDLTGDGDGDGDGRSVALEQLGEYELSGNFSAYAARFDRAGSDHVFVAAYEMGLLSIDVSDPSAPTLASTLPTSALDGLRPSNFEQRGDLLFVAIGGFQGSGNLSGLGVVSVEDPASPTTLATWTDPAYAEGAAIVALRDDHAILGAMDAGVVILDIADPAAPTLVSSLLPNPNFPDEPGLFTTPNARGMTVVDDLVYLMYDHGALRIIDISDIEAPVQISEYINTDLYATAASAYNNSLVIDGLLYATIDYCGLEVIDVSDPAAPEGVAWIDPWGCNYENWDGRPGHTNQLEVRADEQLLFVSAGDTELQIYDLTDPRAPVLVGEVAELRDDQVAWGLDVRDDLVVTAMVDNPLGIPYDSSFGGIQLWQWTLTPA